MSAMEDELGLMSDAPWVYAVRDRTVRLGCATAIKRTGEVFDRHLNRIAVVESPMDVVGNDTTLMAAAPEMVVVIGELKRLMKSAMRKMSPQRPLSADMARLVYEELKHADETIDMFLADRLKVKKED